METTSDKLRAFGFSIAVHLAVIAVATLGMFWSQSTVVVTLPGPVIEATLVGPPRTVKPQNTKPRKPEPPKPQEQAKPEPPAPEPPKEDKKDQERVTEMMAAQAAEEKRVQEEQRKKEQQLLEEEQKKAADAEKKKKLEEEKKQQERDRKLKEIAAQQKKLEEQYNKDLMEGDEAVTGQEGKDDSLEAQYFAAIQNAVENAWLRPETTQPGLQCVLDIVQLPSGDVMTANVSTPCNADPLTRQSLEQAVMRAAPLPVKGFESVFRRRIKLNFKFDG
ncbi:cell envelope integrity protein TolA [Tahibacter soli]|uniref:Cell envelope integrity protein TolA n=1 Tax=Tahibacter soli TaxID=2983605 RepID=A0A9X3YRR0_9GAMM|nr:cell envelope integrity protein TolA [Tahibacter soli]MDC8015788.1 cell envelope integrity protein TolA [Tahibacter soli]